MNKILVVDDEKSMQILYADELTEEGYQVITHGSGTGLMDLIERERPDLVLLDIRLGKDNGLALLQDIRNAFYDLPVILCTAYSTFKQDARSIAANDYVVKSFDMRELKSKVKRVFEGLKSTSARFPEKGDLWNARSLSPCADARS
jgi:two-component system response regulator (stage 0 sporulation protein F)